MPNITLSIPEDVQKIIKKHRDIRWSEVARHAIISRAKLLEKLDNLTSQSKLTMKDVLEIDEKIKESVYKGFYK